MKGIQILTEKNKKEVKEHGSYTFPVQVSPEAIQSYEQHSFMWHWHPEIEHGSYPDRWNMSSMTSVILSQKAKGYSATVMLYMPDI